MEPSDLLRVRVPGQPTVTPDGQWAIVAVSRPDLGTDQYTSQLWLIPTSGSGEPRRLTHGWRDGSPRVSPDGRWLAFTRTTRDAAGSRAGGEKGDADGKPQLCVLPISGPGGEPVRITDHPLGAGPPAWSPDSTRLAYTARVPEDGRYGTAEDPAGEKIGPDREPPRRITKMFYRVDNAGFIFDRPSHVFVTAVPGVAASASPASAASGAGAGGAVDAGGGPVQVTSGDFDHGDPTWSPDGQWLTFPGARHDNAGDDCADDVWISRPDGTGLRALTDTTLTVAQPWFTPDGSGVVFLGSSAGEDRLKPVVRNEGLWLVGLEPGSAATRLTDRERYNIASPSGVITPTPGGVLFSNEHRGAVQLLLVPYDGGEPKVLVDGRRQVIGPVLAGDVLVAGVESPASWGDVYAWDADGGNERRLTDLSADYRAAVPVLDQEELTASAPDGYPVHGWIVRPATDGPHPVLLMIHGGPFAQYGWHLFDEAQVYARAGYAVVMGNPRGSSGYGEEHGRAVIGNVGEVTANDLMALLDAALKTGDLDGDRIGVLGGSHGGFMTTWLAAHQGERFKAAISERAVNALDSFTGASDIGWFFADNLYGPDLAQQERQSPLTHADRIGIPMLIIHSEQDWRCPLEQAQRLYVKLKRRGAAPVEMLLFPAEGHELTRSGTPSHRIARFEAIIEWWARWV